jgi:hypothetical protein
MKRSLITAAIIIALPLTAAAQTESLFENLRGSGGYGGPSLKFMQLKSEFGLMVGGQGAFVMGKTLAIGGGGWGLVTEHPVHPVSNPLDDYQLEFNYGGLLLEYLRGPDRMVHQYFDLLIAWGSLSYKDMSVSHSGSTGEDVLFILEPGAYMGLNLTPIIRITAGVGYRFLFGFDEGNQNDFGVFKSDLEGYSINLGMRFGKY